MSGNVTIQHMPHQPLAYSAPHHHVRLNAATEFHHIPVEKRYPRFKADRHRGAVNFLQNVIR